MDESPSYPGANGSADHPEMATLIAKPRRHPVVVEIGGKIHHGKYWVAGQIMTVVTGKSSKSKQVGASPTNELAQQLLAGLVKQGTA